MNVIVVQILTLSILCGSVFARTKSRQLMDVINDAHEGIAAVVLPGQYGIGVAVGTAFFVSDEYLLTAAHVIKNADGAGLYLPIFVPGTKRIGGSDACAFEVVEIDDRSDIALLKIRCKPRRIIRPFRISIGSLPPGIEIAVTGYGALADFPMTFTAFTASQGSMHFGSGLRQMQRLPQFGEGSSVFVLDRPLPGGFSGSPVYLRNSGIVYGVAVEVKADLNTGAPAMALAHPLKKAQQYLEKHHVRYTAVAPLDSFVNP